MTHDYATIDVSRYNTLVEGKGIDNQGNILNKQVNTYEEEDYIEVEVVYEVLEKIGREEEIIF